MFKALTLPTRCCSLILVDEVGRGTETAAGAALAGSIRVRVRVRVRVTHGFLASFFVLRSHYVFRCLEGAILEDFAAKGCLGASTFRPWRPLMRINMDGLCVGF